MTSYTFSQLIDFTRTTSGTYTNSSGFITSTPASVNLLTYTQEFDNAAWIKGGGVPTVTANSIAAPDGTMTADTISQTSSVNAFSISQIAPTATVGLPYTWSVYLKQGTSRYTQLTFSSTSFGAAQYANIDLQTGTVTQSAGSPTVVTTSVGNGWYRVAYTATATAAAAATPFIALINSPTDARVPTITGSSANTIYAWGAQLEQASTATTYTRNYGGLYPPRFDYDPVTLAPLGLLIEEQRTNLQTYSQGAFDTQYTKVGTPTVSDNSAAGIGGPSTASAVTGADVGDYIYRDATTVIGTQYARSIYVSNVNATQSRLVVRSVSSACDVYLNWSGATLSSLSASIGAASFVDCGNGIYRVILIYTALETTDRLRITPASVAGLATINIYGAQLEAGAFATSYIPTVASQVTRTADQAAINAPNFASWYNQSEGSWTAEFMPYSVTGSVVAQISDATNSNRFQLLNDNSFQIGVTTAAVGQGGIDAGTVNASAVNKLAYAYRTNDTAASLNNGAAVADNTVTLPAVDRLCLGSNVTPASFLNGHIRSIRYYPTRLTDAQLQALTA